MIIKSFIKRYLPEVLMTFFTLCGIVLFWLGYEKVVELTPLYIGISIVLVMCKSRNRRVLAGAFIVAVLIGLAAEYVGVHTGLLFGDYTYGTKMGLLIEGVPLLIGPLWALVTISFWSLGDAYSSFPKVFVIALATACYDIVLEHFAVRYGLWQWAGSIPVSNFFGWFAVSACIYAIFAYKKYTFNIGRLGFVVLSLQTVFFIALILLY
jgi:bisanhydrobacterioruberin hydratase